VANSWRTIEDAPIELTDANAVWTGREMIVFGAALHAGNVPESKTAIGAAYDPRVDEWRRLPPSNLSPQASTISWNGRELIAWDYLNKSDIYDPDEDTWRGPHAVPVEAGECFPRSVSVGRDVFGAYCGLFVSFGAHNEAWKKLTPEFLDWSVEPVAAEPVVLLLGRNAETDDELLMAYRAPNW